VSPQGVVGTAGRSSSLAIVRSQTNCPASPRGSGLLPDGDFSQAQQPSGNSEYGLPEGTKFAPSWVVTGPQTIDFYGAGAQWLAPNGVCSVDLDGTPGPGGIQTDPFATDSGVTYTVRFLLSGNGECGRPRKKNMLVTAAGQEGAFVWDTAHGHDAQHGDFRVKKWHFDASSSLTTLQFQSTDRGGVCGAVVAAISVRED
jgi:hypothetical protein